MSDEPVITHSSELFGRYGVTKYRDDIRKQWALTHHVGCVRVAAYFTSEREARWFAEAMGVTIEDYREDTP